MDRKKYSFNFHLFIENRALSFYIGSAQTTAARYTNTSADFS